MNEQSDLTPRRRAEIKRMRLYLWLGVIFGLIGFACTWGAGKATEATLPDPIAQPIIFLWIGSLLGWLACCLFLARRDMLQSEHVTEDAIETREMAIAVLKQQTTAFNRFFDEIERTSDQSSSDETYNALKAIVEDNRDALDRITSPKRGRRPLTQDQMKREIDRAEQKRAELQAQGDHPTEAEIARAIGLSPKTLQRYRDQVDNKGQK